MTPVSSHFLCWFGLTTAKYLLIKYCLCQSPHSTDFIKNICTPPLKSLPNRGTPAAWTKPHWQPYNSIPNTTQSPAAIYLHTPTSVPTSPHTQIMSYSNLSQLRSIASSSGSSAFPIPLKLQRISNAKVQRINFLPAWLVGPYHLYGLILHLFYWLRSSR